MTTREALSNFIFWVIAAMLVNAGVWWTWGAQAGAEFFGSWALEKALSLDNLFMFYFIFTAFGTPREARPRVLRWGIVGVIIMRGLIIWGGTTLITRFSWLLLGFSLFLIWAAAKIMFMGEEKEPDDKVLQQNWLLRLTRKVMPFDGHYHGDKFLITKDGKTYGTLLLLVVIVIEGTDIPFAFDSLPAALAVSQNFYIVMSSNLLAVMGLRAIYFLIENMQERFSHMKYGIGLLLGFAGVKIIMGYFGLHLPLLLSVGIIVAVIAATIGYTFYKTRDLPTDDDAAKSS
jgi:tellurite resistance protein TerC